MTDNYDTCLAGNPPCTPATPLLAHVTHPSHSCHTPVAHISPLQPVQATVHHHETNDLFVFSSGLGKVCCALCVGPYQVVAAAWDQCLAQEHIS